MRVFAMFVSRWVQEREKVSRAVGDAGAGRARRNRRDRCDRGDVPGWVMVTVMTAALVVALMAVAVPQLRDVFTNAIDSVVSGG
ncbi:hypothetical protein [Protofrankia symbiont of Coriaria ruscifolia]|uniref:Putative membrane protein n=1 Tax=Candidatus Protofrankia californiensis TaxID=1839754 RepID=A0A1C3NW37_9ACTN|nr:hypothetical protein [Protofrankia symbiont of Coriaria ruscifolia]SBW20402.1 putative membrane protein [Candidatus Protofrankia californiensis]